MSVARGKGDGRHGNRIATMLGVHLATSLPFTPTRGNGGSGGNSCGNIPQPPDPIVVTHELHPPTATSLQN